MSLPRFGRLGEPGREIPALSIDRALLDLRPLTADIDGAFLSDDGLSAALTAAAVGDLPVLTIAGIRMGPPIARPSAVICIGQNYAKHAAESGSSLPDSPVVFLKHPNTVVGPDDVVQLPPGATRLDYEVELGVVVGRRASHLRTAEEAITHVAGYVLSHDVSERAYQLEHSGGQWSKGKCCPTFNPLGPWLVPATHVDPQRLGLRSWVNGELRQDSSTADMIFSVAELVRHLSWYMTLEPGDLVNTGTPEGVALSGRFPYLRVGDVVTLEIDHLGRQQQRVGA
jgi:2,4-diketo-3-deoxy-L-fuconate hydrolase